MPAAVWDLTALINAADPKASRPERHLWLVRLVQWLRHGDAGPDTGATARPVLRLKHLLNVLERNEQPRHKVVALLGLVWRETDMAALFADAGFSARRGLWAELVERVQLRLLPATPDTDDLSVLFQLSFDDAGDADWLRAIDDETLGRLTDLMASAHDADWRAPLLQAMTWLVSATRAAAFAPLLRRRMSAELLAGVARGHPVAQHRADRPAAAEHRHLAATAQPASQLCAAGLMCLAESMIGLNGPDRRAAASAPAATGHRP